jgi:hypothetical protein
VVSGSDAGLRHEPTKAGRLLIRMATRAAEIAASGQLSSITMLSVVRDSATADRHFRLLAMAGCSASC